MKMPPYPLQLSLPSAILALAVGLLLAPLGARAFTSCWTKDGNGSWNDPLNWNNGVPVNAGDTAIITNVISSANIVITINTAVSLGTLIIGPKSNTYRYSFAANGLITMDSGGPGRAVLQQVGSAQNYCPAKVAMNSDLEINNSGGGYFNLVGTAISGNHDILINANGNTGTPYIGNLNTFIGNLTICSGSLMNSGSGDPFGSVTNGNRVISITNNTAFRMNSTFSMATNRIVVIGEGNGNLNMNNNSLTVNGPAQLSGSGKLTIYNSTAPGGLVVLGGPNNGFSGPIVLNNAVQLRLSSGGSLNNVPVINLSSATCTLEVTAKLSGYSIPSNQVVAGIGTVTGSVNVANAAATIHPGSYMLPGPVRSPGVLTIVSGGLSVTDGGVYAWDLAQLKDNAFAPGTTTYSQLNLTDGNANLAGGKLVISFLNDVATPASSDTFWKSDHVWTILTSASPPTGKLTVLNSSYGSRFFTTRVNGNTLELVYTRRPGLTLSVQ